TGAGIARNDGDRGSCYASPFCAGASGVKTAARLRRAALSAAKSGDMHFTWRAVAMFRIGLDASRAQHCVMSAFAQNNRELVESSLDAVMGPADVDSCIVFHGCPPSSLELSSVCVVGRLNVVTPFHHLSGDSHLHRADRGAAFYWA